MKQSINGETILDKIYSNPIKYLGEKSISHLNTFLLGYSFYNWDFNSQPKFQDWIRSQLPGAYPAVGWASTILFVY